MFAILHALGMFVVDLFKSRSWLEAENLFLRYQLAIALRSASSRKINAVQEDLLSTKRMANGRPASAPPRLAENAMGVQRLSAAVTASQ
jgi:hypothetical protein